MALTQTGICNSALALIGEQAISAITDDKPRAEALNEAYEPTLREILDSHPWNFAKKRVTLTPEMTPPEFGWAYGYTLPADYISTVQLNGTERWKQVSDDFEIEGGSLLTDATTCELQYIFYQTDTSKYPGTFAAAFAYLLAARTAAAIRQDGAQLAPMLENAYFVRYLPRARMRDGNMRKRRPYNRTLESDFLASRRFSTRG